MEKEYLLLYQACGRGWELPETQVQKTVQMNRVPFMRRFGLLAFAAVVTVAIIAIRATDPDKPGHVEVPVTGSPAAGVAHG